MKSLYLLTRQENEETDWDQYFGVVVCAESEEEAKTFHPSGNQSYWEDEEWRKEWTKNPLVKFIGQALGTVSVGVVLASFNAA